MSQTPLVLKMGGRLLQDQAALDALLKSLCRAENPVSDSVGAWRWRSG